MVLWADRELARRAGVSQTFVGFVRKSLSTVDSERGQNDSPVNDPPVHHQTRHPGHHAYRGDWPEWGGAGWRLWAPAP